MMLSGCITIHHANWVSSNYDPTKHTFKVDSVDLKKYGQEEVERYIRKGWADGWIVDSIAYFNFYIEQEISKIPIIPIFYRLRYQKQNALYSFQISIRNNKIYKSLDSVSYVIYDSLETVCYKGGYNYNANIAESRPYELFKSPYSIELQLTESDILYGDIELFFTDYRGKQVSMSIQKSKFKYKEGKYFTSDFNY